MILLLLALALPQVPEGPTVGDTVWIERTVRLPAGATIRPRPIESSDLLDPLAAPMVVLRGGEVVLRYPVVFWRPGSHRVELPGPIAVRPDGWSDTLPASQARVEIGSVLPRGDPDSIPPEPAAALIERLERSPQPVLLLLLVAGLGLLPVHSWWRRRGPRVMSPPGDAGVPVAQRLGRWLAAGESRAVLDEWRARIRALPDSAERVGLLAQLDAARYGERDPEAVARLQRAALAMIGSDRP